MEEIWKLFKKGYISKDGREINPIYISNYGNVKGRKLSLNDKGYFTFCYQDKTYKLHRVVAELFIPNPDNKRCIDHINTIRTDNRVENLRWCSQKENINNPLSIQKYKQSNLKNGKLGAAASAKKHSKAVQCIETGEIFNSARNAEGHYNLKHHSVSNAANPKQSNQTAGGYHWKYV